MPALNRVQLIGNLGKDPEVRFTPKGTKVTEFTVAVGRRWRNSQGEMQEATDWFNVAAWGRLGEICHEYLKKGSLVYLEGRLQTDRYEKDGEARYITRVIALHMQMLGHRHESTTSAEPVDEQPEQIEVDPDELPLD